MIFTIDPSTGNLVVEGLEAEEFDALAGDLLPTSVELNCGRPLATVPLNALQISDRTAQVARMYHGSLVDGPGRRSVVQFQGCPIRCPGCYVPETHDEKAGTTMAIAAIVLELAKELDNADGVTIMGGEPFAQPVALLDLLTTLNKWGVNVLVYSGFTLEHLAKRFPNHLALIDILIDGPYIKAKAEGAGEYKGSSNQRITYLKEKA